MSCCNSSDRPDRRRSGSLPSPVQRQNGDHDTDSGHSYWELMCLKSLEVSRTERRS